MSSYISSLIEPVVRQARRFSRPSADFEPSSSLSLVTNELSGTHATGTSAVAEEAEEHSARNQNEALDRVLVGDEQQDVLSPMSISTPSEDDLRRIDHQRLTRSSLSNSEPADEEYTRNRGTTDPLPRPSRQSAADLRRASWQARYRRTTSSLSGSIVNEANPRAGAAGFIDDPSQSRSVRASVTSENMSPSMPGTPDQESRGAFALPEDDGMRVMRSRIQTIQALGISQEEKSRMMHTLMTEKYTVGNGKHHRDILRDAGSGRSRSPASLRSQDAPLTPRSDHSGMMDGLSGPAGEALASPTTSLFTNNSEADLQVTTEDLAPTYYSKQATTSSGAGPSTSDTNTSAKFGDEDMFGPEGDNEKPLGCAHYMRNVKLQCHACLQWYTCRFCHDEVEDHKLERRKTRNMLCMLCGTAQPAAGTCRQCAEDAAAYYCDICKLWDNDVEKSIYHCTDCGICRIGQGIGKDFFHCKTCDVCISMNIKNTHKCIERSVDCDCPICGEYMFTSPQTVVFMPCGHSIHHTCYKLHLETSFKCPICSRSIMNMENTFRHLDRAIDEQPMPEGFRNTKALIYCNDCRGKSSVPYHWLGLKCSVCDSYNTVQTRIIGPNKQLDPSDRAQGEDPSYVGTPGPSSGLQTGIATPRGRSESGNAQIGSRSRRPTSTSAIQDLRTPLGPDHFYPIVNNSRSVSAVGTDRARPNWQSVADAASTEVMDMDDNDDDEDDDDELNFWGGDLSPRLRALANGTRLTVAEEEEEEGASDSDDEIMADIDTLDDDDDDEEGEADEMDIFGHR